VTLEAAYEYCLSRPGAEETYPFGETVLVMKVGGKMFALMSLDALELTINLKCDPERAQELRGEFEGITAGYHMNKKHWNTVRLDSDVPGPTIRELIDHSHGLVVASLPRAAREQIGTP
jgi:predicted DNA-binding protein (MmcQ/YjbR family)